jgi:hypothetical protein
MKVKFLAFDRTLGTGTTVFVELPQSTIPGDEGMQAEVVLGIGVNDAAIGRIRAKLSKVRARRELGRLFGSGQRTAPLDAQAVRAKAPTAHRQIGQADRDALFEPQGASVLQTVLVTLIERDDQGYLPTASSNTEETQSVISGVQRSGLNR